jgi:uncharacterized protein
VAVGPIRERPPVRPGCCTVEPALNDLPRKPLNRRQAVSSVAVWTLAATGLATAVNGCGTSPPVQLYHLRAQPPETVPAAAAADTAEIWQLMQPVRVPEYLDREAILLPQGQTGLLALSGHRWAESLRDAIPRLLRQDLAALRGQGRVWAAPVPKGVSVARQLRVELAALDVAADRRSVHLQARWTLSDPQATQVPRTESLELQIAATDDSIDALVAAHRLALGRLAVRIAS